MFNYTTIWIVVGILLLLSEFLIPGFTIFFFGVGALITAVAVFVFQPIEDFFIFQVIIFIVTSTVSLVTLRRFFKKSLKGELFEEKTDYIGEECKVIETVTETKPGRIRYQGTTWTAYSKNETIRKNQIGQILSKKEGEPMVFIIEKKVKEK